MKKGHTEWFFYGNIDESQALKLVNDTRNTVNFQQVKKTKINLSRAVNIPENVKNLTLNMELTDKKNDNSALLSFWQVGLDLSPQEAAVNAVVVHYLDAPTFNQLRTIE